MPRWKTILAFLLTFLITTNGYAMETVELTCSACDFKTTIGDGPLKLKFLKTELMSTTFFCRKTKEFVMLDVITNEELFQKSTEIPKDFIPATDTGIKVEEGSNFSIYTHPSCPNDLVALKYYRSKKNLACPVCPQGTIQFKTLGYSD